MAQDFVKPIYNSKLWKDCRDGYFASQYGLCELCDRPGEEVHHKTFLTPENINDPKIIYGWENLQLLCRDCHNMAHEKAKEMQRTKNRKNCPSNNGVCFDEGGNLVEKKNVFIVWGAPGSGKTTYVAGHKGKYDIVFDLDYIMSALSLSQTRARSADTYPFAMDIRDLMFDLIERRTYFFESAWIVAMLPERQEREDLRRRLKAELIYMDATQEECLARAKADPERRDKALQTKIIKDYFEKLQA